METMIETNEPAGKATSPERQPGLDRSDIPAPLPGRPMWVIFGTLLLLLALGWGTFNVVELIAHEEHSANFPAIPAADLTRLSVDNDTGSVTVVGTDTDTVHVSAEISEGLRGTDYGYDVFGSTLEVRGSCPLIGDLWCHVNYTIEVPSRLDVEVNSDNARVDISNVNGDVIVDADNGTTELSSIAGSIQVNSDNGRISGTDLFGPIANVETDNGRIELHFSAEPDEVTADSDNGSIELVVPPVEGGYNVTTDTDNGNEAILVNDNPDSRRIIDVSTDNGNITVRSTE